MLNRKTRTEILANSNERDLDHICEMILEYTDIKMLEEPSGGLVMAKMRETAQNTLFYLGEIYTTECKVMIDGVIGLGIIQGIQPMKAKHMATIDAAYNADIKGLELIDKRIAELGKVWEKKKSIEVSDILRTKVDFITLDEEVKG
ncbi:alpha-D-ribose 1-methylphosphonate 5-triphosphate synthase subunit PhnG [Dethiosulfatibacter aminovorans DSM 17477]|uniref:Alpha-D-ribose 1-methylphosphonate 5-triphosphate synthase subunit PhnG n=1 Tax=Dethiosulfatibacter aminovorans DSM 17477 TaxID=1121476 RepID=A0A1M6AYD8_9FIRM|nr:phosphonate C-P lyase system protein PhnG [Dethiosulfatibacter aminovorans]SHI41466.1 alpha-D-ribose 1-methylphosphonate 5-triphosphate synthase subunit PhnG [Dethiosulfatibacter aminovorans DSM 17477]